MMTPPLPPQPRADAQRSLAPHKRVKRAALLSAAALIATITAGTAHADSDAPLLPATPNPVYTQECGACHLPYPPALLPAASWPRLMAKLNRHYGTDASLDPAAEKALTAWLQANAGTYKKVRRDPTPPPDERITRSAWFQREHREISPAVWQRPAVKSAANCAACHTQAEQGDFSERQIRIPR